MKFVPVVALGDNIQRMALVVLLDLIPVVLWMAVASP